MIVGSQLAGNLGLKISRDGEGCKVETAWTDKPNAPKAQAQFVVLKDKILAFTKRVSCSSSLPMRARIAGSAG